MKGILSALVTILFHVLTLASRGTGIYCVGKKQPWWNSMAKCHDQGGTPFPYMMGLENVLDTQTLRQSIAGNTSIWTASFLIRGGSPSEQLCGFRYMPTPSESGQMFYGNCNKTRSYICWNSKTSNWQIYEGHYYHAIDSCGDNILGNINYALKPGYYWFKETQNVRKVTLYGQYAYWRYTLNSNPTFIPFKCGAFSTDAGPYFRSCTDKIQSLCHFVNPAYTSAFVTCSKDSTAATKRSAISTVPTISNHLVTKSTSRQNQTKTSQEDRAVELGEERKDPNLGKTVGLPVGLSLAVIGGIIFAIYMFRRYKCWKTTSHGNKNSKAKRPGKTSSTQRVIAYGNSSYDATPNNYSFVNKTGNKVGKDGEQCYATEEEYDVSCNVQSNSSNTSNNIYNTMQSEAYDSANNVSRGVHCDHVYDRTQRQETDSVYDSTRQIKDITQCDNVYNHLSEATARDDQNYYESTLNTNKLGLVTDQTYGKLK